MKQLIALILTILLTGCMSSKPLTFEKINDISLSTMPKTIVLLNSTKWDMDIKKNLYKEGFKIKNYSSIIRKLDKAENGYASYNKAEARFGINQHPGSIVDVCSINSSVQFDEFTIELVDLVTNETVLYISKGGWTGNCGLIKGDLFKELISELNALWK